MSAEATGYVIRHAPYSGSTLLVLMMVADIVNDQHDNECWMTLNRLSEKSRCNRDTVRRAMHTFTQDGWLEIVGDGSRGRSATCYRFLFPEGDVVFETRNPRNIRGSENDISTGGEPVDNTGVNPRIHAPNPRKDTTQPADSRAQPAAEPRHNPRNSNEPKDGHAVSSLRGLIERNRNRADGLACTECLDTGWVDTGDDDGTFCECPKGCAA